MMPNSISGGPSTSRDPRRWSQADVSPWGPLALGVALRTRKLRDAIVLPSQLQSWPQLLPKACGNESYSSSSHVLAPMNPKKHGVTPGQPATLKTGSFSENPIILKPTLVCLCFLTVLEALAGHAEPTEHPVMLFWAQLYVEGSDYLLVLLQRWP